MEKSTDKLGIDVLMFSGTSDNENSIDHGVDMFLNVSGSVRCICRSFSLEVNESISVGDFHDNVIRRINNTGNYVNHRLKVRAKLSFFQFYCIQM